MAALLSPAAGYWDGSSGRDPYTEAMEKSRRARVDPSVLQKDPDYFKKMFGQLAIEQNQAMAMHETQSVASKEDMCMVCHGMVAELELMMQERRGYGKRDELAVTEALEGLCHLNRYQKRDALDPTKVEEHSRMYGGIAPPVFSNACTHVISAWDDHEGVDSMLVQGGAPERLHRELRERVCDSKEGVCHGTGTTVIEEGGKLRVQGKEEQCSEDGGKTKTKTKKKRRRRRKDGSLHRAEDVTVH